MNTATITLHEGYFVRRSVMDWAFAALVAAGCLFAFSRYSELHGCL
jgi:hypothetical protein